MIRSSDSVLLSTEIFNYLERRVSVYKLDATVFVADTLYVTAQLTELIDISDEVTVSSPVAVVRRL